MKIEEPATYREKYAAEAGAVIQTPGTDLPGWEAILNEGEELLWQGEARPKLNLGKRWWVGPAWAAVMVACGIGLSIVAYRWVWPLWIFAVPLLAWGLIGLVPEGLRHYLGLRGSIYSLSNLRAFRGEVTLFRKRRLVSWPITADTSFRLVRGDPPSVRFYEGRLESGRRPRYHEVFEAIVDAPEVYELLQRIQKDVA